jgi:hypothetical protein
MENEITRRAFLKTGTAAVATGSFHVTPLKSTDIGKSQYEAEVPDTLDLAKRAALSVNALTGAAAGP